MLMSWTAKNSSQLASTQFMLTIITIPLGATTGIVRVTSYSFIFSTEFCSVPRIITAHLVTSALDGKGGDVYEAAFHGNHHRMA